jgi:putative membrane protein
VSSASSPTPPGPASPARSLNETTDATRRTRLAEERTYLAWWRTGLTAIAVGIATGGIASKLVGQSRWAYVGIGFGFALLGAAALVYGYRRHAEVTRALERGEFAPPDERVLLALTAVAAILGVLTAILLLFSL